MTAVERPATSNETTAADPPATSGDEDTGDHESATLSGETSTTPKQDERNHDRLAVPMLWVAGIRIVLGVAVIPLIPWLWERHYFLVVLARPTKEILLTGGFLARKGDVALLPLVLVAIPLIIGGVWPFYGLGLAYKKNIEDNDLTGFAGRLLRPKRIRKVQKVVLKGGPRIVFLARLAAFPSSVMAAAAGSSGMPARKFLMADGLGAVASLAEVLLAGYLLGEAYEQAGVWLTVVGAVVLIGLALLLGRYVRNLS